MITTYSGFGITPCQPQNCSNGIASQTIWYLMNHSLDWHQYMLKLKLGCYSISYQFLLIIWIFLIVWLVNLFKMANHWNGFEGYCISPYWAEFPAFYEHFCRFLKFLTLAFQKVFHNYITKKGNVHTSTNTFTSFHKWQGLNVGKHCFLMMPISYFTKKAMYAHVQTHPPPATYGNGSVCGKIYFANSVGRWTCVILPKKASSTLSCHNMYKHLQHLPKMVVGVCGKMDLSYAKIVVLFGDSFNAGVKHRRTRASQ